MRTLKITNGELVINEKAEIVYEQIVTPFGTSAKVGVPRRYVGRRAYVIVVKDSKKTG